MRGCKGQEVPQSVEYFKLTLHDGAWRSRRPSEWRNRKHCNIWLIQSSVRNNLFESTQDYEEDKEDISFPEAKRTFGIPSSLSFLSLSFYFRFPFSVYPRFDLRHKSSFCDCDTARRLLCPPLSESWIFMTRRVMMMVMASMICGLLAVFLVACAETYCYRPLFIIEYDSVVHLCPWQRGGWANVVVCMSLIEFEK